MISNFIYLIKNSEESYYKIGVAKNPHKRLSQLQTGSSSKLILINTFSSEIAHKIEKTLHRRYSHLKKEGEWFNFSIVEENNFISDCEKIENSINKLSENNRIWF